MAGSSPIGLSKIKLPPSSFSPIGESLIDEERKLQ